MQDEERSRIILDLLKSVERDNSQSQRGRASEFGVAVGLVNAYLKFCIKKGYVKVRRFPARRYSYLLTPKGLSEKARLTMAHLSYSLEFFRQARTDCAQIFTEAKRRGWKQVLLVGASELAEISALCALERGISICGIVDKTHPNPRFVGFPVFASFAAVGETHDGVIVTVIKQAPEAFADAVLRYGPDNVLAPSLLGLPPEKNKNGTHGNA